MINFFVVVGFFWLRYAEPGLDRPFRCWLPVAAFYMGVQAFLMVAPFLRPPGGKGDTSLPYWLYPVVGIVVLTVSVLYWVVWRKLLPFLGRYRLEADHEKLVDGTAVVVWRRVKRS